MLTTEHRTEQKRKVPPVLSEASVPIRIIMMWLGERRAADEQHRRSKKEERAGAGRAIKNKQKSTKKSAQSEKGGL